MYLIANLELVEVGYLMKVNRWRKKGTFATNTAMRKYKFLRLAFANTNRVYEECLQEYIHTHKHTTNIVPNRKELRFTNAE